MRDNVNLSLISKPNQDILEQILLWLKHMGILEQQLQIIKEEIRWHLALTQSSIGTQTILGSEATPDKVV